MGITCQQDNYIYYIQKILDIKFEGQTSEDATKFIREHLHDAVEKFEENKAQFKNLSR